MENNLVAISITAESLDKIVETISQVNQKAGFIEVRLDYLKDKDLHNDTEEILKAIVDASQKPLIFTFRSGKKEPIPNRTAQQVSRLLNSRTNLAKDYFDFDLIANNTTSFHLYAAYQRLFGQSPQIILSYHDFEACELENLLDTYDRLATLTPDVIKIAAKANKISDQLTVFKLLNTAQKEKLKLIAIAMGEMGKISRLLAPSRGGFLTFSSLNKATESAPGQFTLDEMVELYKVNSINLDTKIYALLGDPVGHSRSPHMHNPALNYLQEDAVYIPITVASEELGAFIKDFVHPATRQKDFNFAGASVTVPHKVSIMSLLDEIDPIAKEIGAVNTIVVKDNKLIGYNTDVIGAINPLISLIDLKFAKVAVLGTGGAARAVVAGLKQQGSIVTVYGRNQEKLSYFADKFNVNIKLLPTSDNFEYDLLINTTPIGMFGWKSDEKMPITESSLKGCKMVYDLVYNPLKTPLLEAAERLSIMTLGGIEMLVAQAAEQLKLWTGLTPPINLMYSKALNFKE